MRLRNVLFSVVALMTIVSFQNCGVQRLENSLTSASKSAGPVIRLVAPISALTNSRNINISYTISTDSQSALSSTTCSLNSANVSCSSSALSLTALTDGDYVVRINAVDNKGLRAIEVVASFRVDATAPILNVSQTPAAITGSTSATFAFTATDTLSGVSAIECALDGTTYSACTSPQTYNSLTAAAHQINIRARDAAGNLSTVYNYQWTVNTAAPVITIQQSTPANSNSTSAAITFSGTSAGAPITVFECSLDGAAYSSCTSPMNYTGLSEGNHTFNVRGRDAVTGNMSNPVSTSWRVDTTSPTAPAVTSSVGASTSLTTATMQFSSTDSGSGIASYSCSLDTQAFATCTSPRNLTGLSLGAHSFRVKSIDNAGNESAVTTFNWTVISSATATITLGWDPNTEPTLAGYRVRFGTSPGVYTQTRDAGLPATVGGVVSFDVSGLAVGATYYLVVVAYDSAGVESPNSDEVSQVVP